MATAAVTSTFVNGTTADATEVNTNFTDLVTFLNNQVVHVDGSKAFTAVVSGVTPTAATHLATKGYVDTATTTVTSILLGPGDLSATRGTAPTLGTVATNYWPAWLLDSAARESVGTVVSLPSGWSTYDVQVWWTNAGAGAGDIAYRYHYNSTADGGTLGITATAETVVTAPAQDVVKVTTVASGLTVTASTITLAAFERAGANAGDTLGNDIGLLAIVVKKAS